MSFKVCSQVHGRPHGGKKRAFAPSGHWNQEAKISRKRESCSLFLFSWDNSCNSSLFADMSPTLQRSQVHCSGSLTCSDELTVH